jgi:hypothetical protein
VTDRVAKAEKIAAKWAATVARLRAEIDRRKGSGKQSKALANAVDALPRAEARAKAAAVRVSRHRRIAAKTARHASDVAKFIGRLDKVAAAAPAVMKRWEKDRKDEPKRIDKRRKQLARRITKDSRSGGGDESRAFFGTGRRAAAPMPAEAETFPSGPIIPYVPPVVTVDRAGLFSGDYRLVNQNPDDFDAYRVPKQWTADYVARRLADAHAVLRRLPMTTRPKEFGAIWPEYQHAAGELAVQAGAGTLHMGKPRTIAGTSAADVARMNQALAWPLTYLANSPEYARAVNDWAFEAGLDGVSIMPDSFALAAAEQIAKHLNAKKVEVT